MELLVRIGRREDGKVVTELGFPLSWNYKHAALVACDLVRHIALAYHVDEDDVWDMVETEREHPSTEIERPH
jgi:hypothetical protein